MKSTINSETIKDPIFHPKKERNYLERFILRFIRDERDLPFIYLCLKLQFLVIPLAIYLFFNFSWWIALPYFAINMLVFVPPYILMLHNTSHRKLFKKKYGFFNHYIPWILGPFCGETPETYFCHHIGMHHVEGNLPPDLSTTMTYQRDSFVDFHRYFFKFFFFVIFDLTRYFKQRNLSSFIKRLLMGELSFLIMASILTYFNWRATLIVFWLPFIIIRYMMMAGNWAQHAFVDTDDPANSYKNSITCINSAYNRKCFNDGYHIGHHIRPSMHWTDMPVAFIKNQQKYVEQKAIVFKEIDFFFVWLMLMTKNYNHLAGKFVDIGNVYTDKDSIIQFLKTRTQKISPEIIAKWS